MAETGSTGTGLGAVSSAGAEGPFQFIPETAASYNVDVGSFQSSANGAAHLLHDLHKQYGSWNTALEHYSGGGYGVSHVSAKAAEGGVTKTTTSKSVLADIKTPLGTIPFPGPTLDFTNPLGPLSPVNPKELGLPGELEKGLSGGGVGSLFNFPSEIVEAFQQFTKLSHLVSDPKFWIRVGEAVGGMIILYMALRSLTGTGVTDLPGGKLASQSVKAAAFKRLPPAQRTK